MKACGFSPTMWPTASARLWKTRWEVAKIHIRIGEVRTLDTENWQTIPDDRQQQVEIIGGSVVQDFGRVPEGDKISCTVTVLADGWKIICEFWEKRTPVTVEDEAGNLWRDLRVVVKSYAYVDRFPRAYKVTLEFWRI